MKPHHHHSRPHLLLWAALFLFSCVPLCSAQLEHTEISLFPFHQPFQISPSKPRFYRLDLFSAPKDLDLLVSVVPATGSYSPKLFISNNKEFPQKANDAVYSSVSTSENVVLISSKDLKDLSKRLFLGLVCGNDLCDAKISVEWTKEIKAIADGSKTIEDSKSLNGANAAVVRLAIPKPSERRRHGEKERIVIHVDALRTSSEKESSPLEVFISQGNTIPFTNNAESIPRRSSWFEGNTIIIEKDSSLYCTECMLTLNLRFKESSSISIQGGIFQERIEIYGEPLLDGVQKGKYNTYQFTGNKNQQQDLILSVKVHQGRVKISIPCDAREQSLYVENSREIIISSEIINPSDLDSRCNFLEGIIYVHGEESSVYSLQASYTQANQLFMGMRKALPITSEIGGEKIIYQVLVPLFSAEEITLDLRYQPFAAGSSRRGPRDQQFIDVDVIQCRFPMDCPGIIPAKSQDKITNYYGFDDLSVEKFTFSSEEISSGGRLVKINPKESGCSPIIIQDEASKEEALPVCAYLVTLSNRKNTFRTIEYTLSTEFNPEGWQIVTKVVILKFTLFFRWF